MSRVRLLIVGGCCGLLFLVSTVNASDYESRRPEEPSAGLSLYEEFCSACHRPLNKTAKPQRSLSRIRSSIKQFPPMGNLSFLTDEQLKLIVSELATVSIWKGRLNNPPSPNIVWIFSWRSSNFRIGFQFDLFHNCSIIVDSKLCGVLMLHIWQLTLLGQSDTVPNNSLIVRRF